MTIFSLRSAWRDAFGAVSETELSYVSTPADFNLSLSGREMLQTCGRQIKGALQGTT
jgi:hypothetical protein